MQVYLGKNSSNQPETIPIQELNGLFVVYNYQRQWEAFLHICLQQLMKTQGDIIRVRSCFTIQTLKGTLAAASLRDVLKYIREKIRRHSRNPASAPGAAPAIVIFDDLFQPGMFKRKDEAKTLLQLFTSGPACGLYFLAGTSGLFRGLLKELFRFSGAALPHPAFFSELVINDENLHFFREKGSMEYRRLF